MTGRPGRQRGIRNSFGRDDGPGVVVAVGAVVVVVVVAMVELVVVVEVVAEKPAQNELVTRRCRR